MKHLFFILVFSVSFTSLSAQWKVDKVVAQALVSPTATNSLDSGSWDYYLGNLMNAEFGIGFDSGFYFAGGFSFLSGDVYGFAQYSFWDPKKAAVTPALIGAVYGLGERKQQMLKPGTSGGNPNIMGGLALALNRGKQWARFYYRGDNKLELQFVSQLGIPLYERKK